MIAIALRWLVASPLAVFLSALMLGPAGAAECDCSKIIGKCSANVTYQNERLHFTSPGSQCRQIGYQMNDQVGTITITGGSGSLDYFTTKKKSRPIVRFCRVCATRETRKAFDTQKLHRCSARCRSVGHAEAREAGKAFARGDSAGGKYQFHLAIQAYSKCMDAC